MTTGKDDREQTRQEEEDAFLTPPGQPGSVIDRLAAVQMPERTTLTIPLPEDWVLVILVART